MKAASPFRSCAERSAARLLAAALLLTAATAVAGRLPLSGAPVVWYADDARPIPKPATYEPHPMIAEVDASVSQPVARGLDPTRWLRAGGGPAVDVNALDEVPNSTWFTNRMGIRRLMEAELATGPGAAGPDTTAPWVIIGAKSAGVTMGFRIRDARGDVWLLKFDPPDHPGQSIRAGVVSNLILHACGYNVPRDRVVVFDRDQFDVGEAASLRGVRRAGGDIRMTAANLDSVLQATRSVFGGRYHALASKYLDGAPVGPIRAHGRRPDDRNDTVAHQRCRPWRGLRVIAAWINHYDTKDENSLDMYLGDDGAGHVVHYLIDFASTLGASGAEMFPKFGYEHGVDVQHTLRRIASLGLSHDDWQEIAWPTHLDEVGYFSAERFDPEAWRPISPHAGFANLDDRDGYWAAKIVSGFTDGDLRVLVQQGRYQDPRAVDWLVEHLGRRRDIIARTWFDRVAPLDFFVCEDGRLVGHDLGVERSIYPAATSRYRSRHRVVCADRTSRAAWSAWIERPELRLDLDAPTFTGAIFICLLISYLS